MVPVLILGISSLRSKQLLNLENYYIGNAKRLKVQKERQVNGFFNLWISSFFGFSNNVTTATIGLSNESVSIFK